jgi:gliding motility-associated-like protein
LRGRGIFKAMKPAVFSRFLLGFVGLFFLSINARGQYILNGSATQINCNCYQLTPSTPSQSGSVWNSHKISLNNSFDFTFNVYLGCTDANGADGMVFMLQPLSTSVGTIGEGMGFSGVSPSIGITLDTYQNSNLADPSFDHISIQANGNAQHGGDLAGPVAISDTSGNVEDCQWHRLRISWNPATRWLRSYFDDVLRVECQVDLVGAIFNSDPNVFWGFSAATGGSVNVQQFCTALNPGISSTLPSDTFCLGTPVQFVNNSVSFAPISAYYWDFGDGFTSTQQNPPPHSYTTAGTYPLEFAITALDGCRSDTIRRTIHVAPPASGDFTAWDTCTGLQPRIQLTAGVDVSYHWSLDGTALNTGQTPVLTTAPEGAHQLQLQVRSLYGCGAPVNRQWPLTLFAVPVVLQQVTDGCVRKNWNYAAHAQALLNIREWHWDFGNGMSSLQQNGIVQYSQPGSYPVSTWAVSTDGCRSDTIETMIQINRAIADAGPDLMLIGAEPVFLQGSGNGSFSWSPAGDLSDAMMSNPRVTSPVGQTFFLTVTTPEGCTAIDSVHMAVFNGSEIRVPNAFTPNNDGRNDLFRPDYKGIKQLLSFTVYNRWGQPVYETKDPGAGWDGRHGNTEMGTGSFVWTVVAMDWVGKVYQLKGVVTLIR